MRGIQGQVVFLQPDLEQILQAILQADAMAQQAGAGNQAYHAGFVAAVATMATAIGVDVDIHMQFSHWRDMAGQAHMVVQQPCLPEPEPAYTFGNQREREKVRR